nr:hypothetical protein [Tanacetum cinerariifolium]GEZ71096.1 hypothetical protein [Tanacetum cinerariifolium]
VKPSTSANGSQPSGNTKKDKIQRPPKSIMKNKIEANLRTVKSSLENKNCAVEPQGTPFVQHSKLNANSELICVKCKGCMLSDNHDLYVPNVINYVHDRPKSKYVKKNSKRKVWKPTGKVFTKIGYTWRPTGQTFTIVRNACPLTRKPRKNKTTVPVSKSKIIKSISANNKEPSKSWGSIVSDVPSSTLDECSSSEPILYEITPATISSGFVPNPPPSTLFVPPSRTDWDLLFQSLFDELLTPPASVDFLAPEVIAPIAEVVAPKPAASFVEPKNFKQAMIESSWINVMQEEIHEFERLQV